MGLERSATKTVVGLEQFWGYTRLADWAALRIQCTSYVLVRHLIVLARFSLPSARLNSRQMAERIEEV